MIYENLQYKNHCDKSELAPSFFLSEKFPNKTNALMTTFSFIQGNMMRKKMDNFPWPIFYSVPKILYPISNYILGILNYSEQHEFFDVSGSYCGGLNEKIMVTIVVQRSISSIQPYTSSVQLSDSFEQPPPSQEVSEPKAKDKKVFHQIKIANSQKKCASFRRKLTSHPPPILPFQVFGLINYRKSQETPKLLCLTKLNKIHENFHSDYF
ncbi:hypothetical protein BpHYR1_038343 [Brachionus plicatilis]|uniref:Uncharacterized protein n=1 Tax=Brachionus plicatilis TaxID=10195 RepID=A0A3M7RDP4_BRAPC|nr:hypothetical protein BpHYR1_038343 [Brachionus plicatilis]